MSELTLPLHPTRHCKIVVVPGAFSLDVFGPVEVFTMGARLWSQRARWDSALGTGATDLADGTDASERRRSRDGSCCSCSDPAVKRS